jgi:hypothetical protein
VKDYRKVIYLLVGLYNLLDARTAFMVDSGKLLHFPCRRVSVVFAFPVLSVFSMEGYLFAAMSAVWKKTETFQKNLLAWQIIALIIAN